MRALDGDAADVAATIAGHLPVVGVAVAHVGATVLALPHDDVVVLTSDADDIVRVSQPRAITTVRI